jgi:hypothetical protein
VELHKPSGVALKQQRGEPLASATTEGPTATPRGGGGGANKGSRGVRPPPMPSGGGGNNRVAANEQALKHFKGDWDVLWDGQAYRALAKGSPAEVSAKKGRGRGGRGVY